jgi:hypothetical protein
VAEDGVLDLSFQNLEEVPSWVWYLSSLKSLILNNNKIAKLSVPKDANVPALESIDLSSNLLQELPQDLASRFESHNFRFLDVSSNRLKCLPDEFFVFFEDRKLQISFKTRGARGSVLAQARDPNWGGWHGKFPKEGFHFVRSKGRYGRSHSFPALVQFQEKAEVGCRISFQGNEELEAELRAELGMNEGDEFDSERVKDMLCDRVQNREEKVVEVLSSVALID